MIFAQNGHSIPAQGKLVFERRPGNGRSHSWDALKGLGKPRSDQRSAFFGDSRAPSGHPLASIWSTTQGGARRRACPGLISAALNRAKAPSSLGHVSMLPRNRPENSVLLHLSWLTIFSSGQHKAADRATHTLGFDRLRLSI